MQDSAARTDLSWQSDLSRELWRLAWPITVSMLSYTAMTTIDTLFVSRLGGAALGGVGLGGVLAFAMVSFGFGGLRSVKVLVSQTIGAGGADRIAPVLGAGVVWGALLGVAALVAGLFVSWLLPDFTASRAAGEHASSYLAIRSYGAPLMLVSVALRECRYGEGDARSPMIATLIANIVHVPLDAALIFGLGWGTAGAAWATVLSQALELALLLRVQVVPALGLRHVAAADLRRLWHLTWPLGLQILLEIGAFATLVAMLSRISEVDLAAHQIVLQLVQASFLPAAAIGEAASVLVGQAVGGNRDDLVKPVARSALIMAVCYTGLYGLGVALFGRTLIAPFTGVPAIAELALKLAYIAAVFQIFDGASIVARGILRGTGDVRFPALLCVAIAWLCTPPLTYLLGIRLGLGAVGGWLGLCLEIIAGALVLWHRFARGAWLYEARLARERVTVPAAIEPAAA